MIRFRGLLAPTEVPTGDGRMFCAGKATHRPLPLPLMAQFGSGGHAGAVPVAKMEKISPGPGGYWVEGCFLDPNIVTEVPKAVYMLQERVLGPSVDLDRDYTVKAVPHPSRPDKKAAMYEEYNIIGATLVPMPAFYQVHLSVETEEEKSLLASSGVDVSKLLDESDFYAESSFELIESPAFATSVEGGNEAECGCNDAEPEQMVQGMVPVVESGTMSTSTNANSITLPVYFNVTLSPYMGEGAPGYGGGHPFIMPMMPQAPAMQPEPAAVVKVFEDEMTGDKETVVKVPDAGIKVKVSDEETVVKILNEPEEKYCYLDEEGRCPACGY